jgi:hypothetical protein
MLCCFAEVVETFEGLVLAGQAPRVRRSATLSHGVASVASRYRLLEISLANAVRSTAKMRAQTSRRRSPSKRRFFRLAPCPLAELRCHLLSHNDGDEAVIDLRLIRRG